MAAENPTVASGRPLSPNERTMLEIAEGRKMGEMYARADQFKKWVKKKMVQPAPNGWIVAGEFVDPIEPGHYWMGGEYLPSEAEFAAVGLAIMALKPEPDNSQDTQ